MSSRVVVWLTVACVTLSCPPKVDAQPLPGAPVVIGALVAWSCPGSTDGIPTPFLSCDREGEGAPGPYLRPYLSVRPERTHPVRAFVGGGVSYFDDPVRHEFRPALPPGVNDGLSWQKRSGWDQVLVAGVLFRVSRRIEGRASYLLAGQLATPTMTDGAWRHEIGVGLGWRVR